MDIIVSDKSSVSLYEQIKDQIISQIISKNIKPGDPLPSIKNLARQLKVSIITVKRAYEELENEGYVETYPSKGSFISSKSTDKMREVAIYEWEFRVEDIVKRSKELGMTLEEGLEIFKQFYLLGD